jgi:hypothetical protein
MSFEWNPDVVLAHNLNSHKYWKAYKVNFMFVGVSHPFRNRKVETEICRKITFLYTLQVTFEVLFFSATVCVLTHIGKMGRQSRIES